MLHPHHDFHGKNRRGNIRLLLFGPSMRQVRYQVRNMQYCAWHHMYDSRMRRTSRGSISSMSYYVLDCHVGNHIPSFNRSHVINQKSNYNGRQCQIGIKSFKANFIRKSGSLDVLRGEVDELICGRDKGRVVQLPV